MPHRVFIFGASALALLVGLAASADAQTVRRHHAAAGEGRQIVVHARESYLTAGPGAPVGSLNSYALSTISSTAPFTPGIDHTFVGLRGQERMPTNLTVPGCCRP